jgi:ketosteroid isomerase-like protein
MMTTKDLQAFFDRGWNRHDIDLLMTFIAEDCVYESTAGPEVCGTRHAGRERVRQAFAGVFEVFPDARFAEARHFVAGDRGVSEWRFTGTTAEGKTLEVDGCDLFTFAGDKIALKSSFFKTRTA